MAIPLRISVQQTREKTLSGAAILVCGYDDNDKFMANNLEGAVSWHTLQARLPDLSKDQEIIFYCA